MSICTLRRRWSVAGEGEKEGKGGGKSEGEGESNTVAVLFYGNIYRAKVHFYVNESLLRLYFGQYAPWCRGLECHKSRLAPAPCKAFSDTRAPRPLMIIYDVSITNARFQVQVAPQNPGKRKGGEGFT